MILALAMAAAAGAANPQEILGRVQDSYQTHPALQAHFRQEYYHKLRDKRVEEEGRLWATRSGKVLWRYESPTPKDFIFDGTTGYFYEPENSQVTVFDDFAKSPLWNALRFLIGQGRFTDDFSAALCGDCPSPPKGHVYLRLTPTEDLANVEWVRLLVNTREHRIAETLVFDDLGNQQRYRFRKLSFVQKVSDKRFRFVPPEGVQVLRAADMQ